MPDAAGNIKGIALTGNAGETLGRIFGTTEDWCPCYTEQKRKIGVHIWNICPCTREGCQHQHVIGDGSSQHP